MNRLTALTVVFVGISLVAACGSDGAGGALDSYLSQLPAWHDFSPQLDSGDEPSGPAEVLVTEHEENGVRKVQRTVPCSLTETPEEIVTFDPNSEILYLGSLIQGQTYLGGLAAMEELPIRQRAPLTISVDLQCPNNTTTVNDPDLASVTQAVGNLIHGAQAAGCQFSSDISFTKQVCHSLDQSMLKLGFSAKYLRASVKGRFSYEHTVDRTSITICFRQSMFTTSIVLPTRPSDFFTEDFTQELLDEQVALGRIGSGNLPVYVSNIVWGRILLMTMTATATESEMKAAIEASYNGFAGDVSGEKRQLVENSTFDLVAIGGNEELALAAIRSGDIRDYFSSGASLTTAAPLSYTLRNLADNKIATVSETTSYDMVEFTDAAFRYLDKDEWRNSVLDLSGTVQEYRTDSPGVANADEVGSAPGNNAWISSVLTFRGDNTGLPFDFKLTSTAGNATKGFTYNDDEFSSSLYPSLSPGDVDNSQDDDTSIEIIPVAPFKEVLAVGLWVGDNGGTTNEWVRVYDQSDRLIAKWPGLPSGSGFWFVGVVSAVPIKRVEFDEEAAGGDDICIRHPWFGWVDD